MAIMFDHAVKYHGQYYPPNTPIEEDHEKAAEASQEGDNVKAGESVEAKAEPPKKAAKSRKKGDA